MKNIDKKFIEYFGKGKLEQENLLGEIHQYHLDICDILGIECVPIVFEDDMEDDSRFYIKEFYIALNTKVKTLLEGIKCVSHECKHIEQLLRSIKPTTEQEKRWKDCFYNGPIVKDYNNLDEITEYALQEIEIDAYAFTQIYIKERLGIEIVHPNELYQKIISHYIKLYYD